jgi:UDP-glucuronate decarboxylase
MNADPGTDGPVNLGNPQEFTIADLARLIIDLSGSSSRVVHRPLPTDDPRQRRPDITRAHQLLDWQPTVGLREGLLRTIAHFENDLIERRPHILRPLDGSLQPHAAE